MASRENTLIEITPDVLLKAYACGIFPMAENADDPALYLDRAGTARDDSARWVPPSGRASRALCAPRVLRCICDRDFDAVIEGCAEPGAGPRAHLDQYAASARSIAVAVRDRGHCHTVEVYDGDASGWRTLWRQPRAAPFSARACSIARAMPRRSRWCIWWRGSRWAATGCSTRSSHRAPEDVRRRRSSAGALSPAARRAHARRCRFAALPARTISGGSGQSAMLRNGS